MIVYSPFRLDLVPAGISDMTWWPGKGQSLSVCCGFDIGLIAIEAELIEENKIVAEGFGKTNDIFVYDSSKSYEAEYMLIKSSIDVVTNYFESNNVTLDKGIYLKYCPNRAKGMGGSSIIAGCIIKLLFSVYDIDIDYQKLIQFVVEAEKRAGIGGGWEDIAGVVEGGVNLLCGTSENGCFIKHFHDTKALSFLENSLFIFDTNIESSTSVILLNAKRMFEEKQNEILENSDYLQKECPSVLKALSERSSRLLGESFLRQRVLWGNITGGLSCSASITSTLSNFSDLIWGYREAGAGGGGILYVVPKEECKEQLCDELNKLGYIHKKWKVSDNGITIHGGYYGEKD